MRQNLNFDYVEHADSENVVPEECFFSNFVARKKRNIARLTDYAVVTAKD